MRILALDVGEKRIGLAVSDALGITAQGLETYARVSREKDLERIAEMYASYGCGLAVLGLPLNMDGSEGPQAERSERFGQMLAERGLTVAFQDERLTSRAATQALIAGGVRRENRKGKVDRLAAVLILQSYMERNR